MNKSVISSSTKSLWASFNIASALIGAVATLVVVALLK